MTCIRTKAHRESWGCRGCPIEHDCKAPSPFAPIKLPAPPAEVPEVVAASSNPALKCILYDTIIGDKKLGSCQGCKIAGCAAKGRTV